MKRLAALVNKHLIILALIGFSQNLSASDPTPQLTPSYWFHQAQAKDLAPDPSQHYRPFSLSSDASGYRIRLLKKLADWHQQHTNGLTVRLEQSATAQRNAALKIGLLIAREHTDIPTPEQRQTWYQNNFKALDLANFDDNKAHLLMTFWSEPDAKQGRWRKDYQLSIAPSEWGRPLDFELPLADFICSYELNYQRTMASSQTDCSTIHWQELTIVSETRDQNVLRNLDNTAFESQVIAEHYRLLQLEQLQLSIIGE
ncbi:hypothetical protein [Simiduia litorea]|uniref:hypothetical protein n=1 Tax=Simiduia litorea TaxID=1435348 RepID=UPI0036F40F16